MRRLVAALVCIVAASCTLPQVVEDLDRRNPSPELGRPDWVTYPAQAGAWLGGGIGAAVSVVLLPITWPVSLLAEEPLGYAKDEFMFFPVSFGAAGGQFLIGTPLDGVDNLFRRAWTNEGRPDDYHAEPQPPPIGPRAADLPAPPGGGEVPEPSGR